MQCGGVKRVSLLIDKYTGLPKGYAVVEFLTADAKNRSLNLNGTLLNDRLIRVEDKRKKVPYYFARRSKFI